MHFRFFLGNHNEIGRRSLEDVIHALGAQILDLGHTADRSDKSVRIDAINIISEGFTELETQQFLSHKRQGLRFILLMPESLLNNSLNDFQTPVYQERYRQFMKVAPEADAIWCLVPGTAAKLRDLNPNAVDVELGYSPRRRRELTKEPNYDFGFFGALTAFRRETLDEFRRRGHSLLVSRKLAPPDERDRDVANCRVILHIRASGTWKIISSSRCSTALHVGRPVVSQPVASRSIWKRIIRFSGSHDSFFDEAARVAHQWELHWQRQFAAFQRLLPAERCIGPAVSALLRGST